MSRSRKVTLSVKEFSHLVSEALDAAQIHPSQSFVDNSTLFSEASSNHRSHPSSSFQRIFSRPTLTPGQRDDSLDEPPEDLFDTPRKMIAWPFIRSPRKNRPSKDDVMPEVHDPAVYPSPYVVTSPAATSTSSLGSLVPADERLFQVSRDSDEPSQESDLFSVAASSSAVATRPSISEPPTDSGHYADAVSLRAVFGGNSSTSSNHSMAESALDVSDQTRPSFDDGAKNALSVASIECKSFDEDPTPRAVSFGPSMPHPPTGIRDDPLLTQRHCPKRLSLIMPACSTDVLTLRPAIGVVPHAPSESESSISACTSSPTSSVMQDASPPSPTMGPSFAGTLSPRVSPSTPPNLRTSAAFPNAALPLNAEAAFPVGFSPRQRKRALSRSVTPPSLLRPPPTGPLPAIPTSVPPVPPLPPLLHKLSMNMSPHAIVSSLPRSAMAGAPTNPATALPPSPPGGLRLPSRLSWVNSVRAVLPSPPASPTKSIKSLSGKATYSISPSKAEPRRPNELKRPTSIGVIEAADNAQVRRTKSILLLGSRSKSNVSLCTKRVQIHADVNLDAPPSRKPRRKSSAATVGHPIFSSDIHPLVTPMASAELLVPRERRHSAPMLSGLGRDMPGVSEDWTLSLPFCTDLPGNKISPLPPRPKSEPALDNRQCEDWTLCMPLKMRAETPTTVGYESTIADSSENGHTQQTVMTTMTQQLPTPSPSPKSLTPCSSVCPLPEEESTVVTVERPVSPASLGPHVGGLDLGGRGKRASGWHVYGWFDEVSVPVAPEDVGVNTDTDTDATDADDDGVAPLEMILDKKPMKTHVTTFRRTQHPSQDSTSSTVSTVFYSARSSLVS